MKTFLFKIFLSIQLNNTDLYLHILKTTTTTTKLKIRKITSQTGRKFFFQAVQVFNFPDLATIFLVFCNFIKFMIKSILNNSQDFTGLNWCSLYPKIVFVRLKLKNISYSVCCKKLKFTIYLSILKFYEFSGETEYIFGCRDSKIREELAICSPRVKLISFLSCQSESLNKEFCWVKDTVKQDRKVLIR